MAMGNFAQALGWLRDSLTEVWQAALGQQACYQLSQQMSAHADPLTDRLHPERGVRLCQEAGEMASLPALLKNTQAVWTPAGQETAICRRPPFGR
jgi:hypothetical protein